MINNTNKFLINFLQEKLILWSDDKSSESIKKLKELEKILETEYKNIDIT
jgi:hypothetical protein